MSRPLHGGGPTRWPGRSRWALFALGALAALLILAPGAGAAQGGACPPIADKSAQVPHVDYTGVQHLTYCYGPINIQPGQNIIRLNSASDPDGTKLFPQVPGYITRFDPDLVYAGTDPGTSPGQVPGVDVIHLHHAVWLVNGSPQFAAGEEKTIEQLPQGFGWRTQPSDGWLINDMLHDLVAKPATVYMVWRLDFVPDSSPDAVGMKTVHTRWMDVAGNPSIYPVFDALRGMGVNGRYTFPDQAAPADRQPCGFSGRAPGTHGCLGAAQTWTPNQNVTLIQTAGHLHPGGLNTTLTDTRGSQTNTLFTSFAHYYEPAGAVSWDVSMGATSPAWRVQVQAGDQIQVHATYDTKTADWYEVMGIMPVAVYNGTDAGGVDAMSNNIPQDEVLTHAHLHENDNHGGGPAGKPDPFALPGFPSPNRLVDINGFTYDANPGGTFTRNPPTVLQGQKLTFKNLDASPSINAFHTITDCRAPCNGSTGIAYPIANGPVTFDSGQLGFNGNGGALPASLAPVPAADRDNWTISTGNLKPGTYTFFCRIHPFMRGSFRVAADKVRFGKLIRNRRRGTARLVVKMPFPGKVVLGGKRVVRQKRAHNAAISSVGKLPTAEAKVKLLIKPNPKGMRKLDSTGVLRVKARVVYSPKGGARTTRTKRIKLIKR